MRRDVCLRCKYFQQGEAFGESGNAHSRFELGPAGECRRNPPVPALTYDGRHDDVKAAIWPVVLPSSWCGRQEQRLGERLITSGLVIRWNDRARTCRCIFCMEPTERQVGLELFIRGTQDVVCRRCGQGENPDLVSMLDEMREQSRRGAPLIPIPTAQPAKSPAVANRMESPHTHMTARPCA